MNNILDKIIAGNPLAQGAQNMFAPPAPIAPVASPQFNIPTPPAPAQPQQQKQGGGPDMDMIMKIIGMFGGGG